MKIQFDERALQRVIDDGMKRFARDANRRMNTLAATHAGRPLPEIKSALQALFRNQGGSISDPELSDYAARIQAGSSITFVPAKSR
ncbi:hypothetical protein [Rathayibacter sp. AY1A7]|jgi:hypothetical protein|uniref:hypothetical protein n=1 Tax=Rathayibacter sp. AY1A7 TaxID=2080524 RepID=UPI000CE741E9|nr:hypothetical protein [Rathayibacter sp. AY1A7]PPF18364.1 hypothetical protein C5B95_12250 [Rathayibacter sp. AY1A7]